jgi:8-oxo-dGTP pyrophosphatase MutT (NUDIX family)
LGKKQFAALPFRLEKSELRVMLITTRNKGRWSVPKGSPIPRMRPHRTAAQEAFEEAGVTGPVAKRAVGSFKHCRWKGERKQTIDVDVFPLKVCRQESWWPEKGERKAIWVSARRATRLVHKAALRRLIARFAAQKDGDAFFRT